MVGCVNVNTPSFWTNMYCIILSLERSAFCMDKRYTCWWRRKITKSLNRTSYIIDCNTCWMFFILQSISYAYFSTFLWRNISFSKLYNKLRWTFTADQLVIADSKTTTTRKYLICNFCSSIYCRTKYIDLTLSPFPCNYI